MYTIYMPQLWSSKLILSSIGKISSTMPGIALYSQQSTQPMFTTSFGKTWSQKPSLLVVSTHNIPPVQPFPDSSNVFYDDYNEDSIPTNITKLTLLSPPTPTTPYLSERFISGAMAKLKKLLNWPPVKTNQISPW